MCGAEVRLNNKNAAGNRSERGGAQENVKIRAPSAVFVRPGPLTMDAQPRRTNGSCAVTLCWQMSIRYFPKKKIKLGGRWTIVQKRLTNRQAGRSDAPVAQRRSTDRSETSSAAALGC